MFDLHLLTGLTNSKKYWRVTKKLVLVLQGIHSFFISIVFFWVTLSIMIYLT